VCFCNARVSCACSFQTLDNSRALSHRRVSTSALTNVCRANTDGSDLPQPYSICALTRIHRASVACLSPYQTAAVASCILWCIVCDSYVQVPDMNGTGSVGNEELTTSPEAKLTTAPHRPPLCVCTSLERMHAGTRGRTLNRILCHGAVHSACCAIVASDRQARSRGP
jgi:hypothetical protein